MTQWNPLYDPDARIEVNDKVILYEPRVVKATDSIKYTKVRYSTDK